MIVVNGYFRTQTVSGQQRYAREIADRLPALVPDVRELRPTLAARSRYGQWVELQLRVPVQARAGTLVSLTSRSPVLGRHQVVTVHDLFPLTHPEWFAPGYAALHRRLLRHQLRHAAGFVAVSEPIADELRGELVRDVPVVVAPNAAHAVFVRPEGSRSPKSYFLAVGNLEPRKNLPRLVRAYGLLDPAVREEFPLLLVGSEASAFRSEPSLTSSLPSGIELLGRVSDAELARLYRDATAYVSVSLAEGFGIPVVEASGAGVGHLVLSDLPVYRWIVGAAEAIFVDSLSVESIAGGLLAATTMPPGRESRRELTGRFSWEASAEVVADLATRIDASWS